MRGCYYILKSLVVSLLSLAALFCRHWHTFWIFAIDIIWMYFYTFHPFDHMSTLTWQWAKLFALALCCSIWENYKLVWCVCLNLAWIQVLWLNIDHEIIGGVVQAWVMCAYVVVSRRHSKWRNHGFYRQQNQSNVTGLSGRFDSISAIIVRPIFTYFTIYCVSVHFCHVVTGVYVLAWFNVYFYDITESRRWMPPTMKLKYVAL